jgi:hypothetical protein
MTFAGYAAGRFGSHRITALMLLVCAAALPLIASATSFFHLAGALFIFGAAYGSMDVCMNANGLAIERAGTTPIMSRLHASWSIGSFIGAFSTTIVLQAGLSVFQQFSVLVGFVDGCYPTRGRPPDRDPWPRALGGVGSCGVRAWDACGSGRRSAAGRVRRGGHDGLSRRDGGATTHRNGGGCAGLRVALGMILALLVVLAATAGRAVGSSRVTAPEPTVPMELP